MTRRISDAQLLRLSELVACHLGLHFPRERWLELQRGVCSAAHEWGCQDDPDLDLDHYIRRLLSPALTPGHLEVLAAYLTVGETYFFRERRTLEVFEAEIVPELIRTRMDKTVRIWSAGCSTGEEPYSIAIMLSKLMAALENWNVEILATDINSSSLRKASAGIYGEWSFRGIPPLVRSAYFSAVEENRWGVSAAIKKMVRFTQLNLMDPSFPPPSNSTTGFDVIFCRNVLMYFTPEAMRKVVQQLYHSLVRDGWLIVSPTEMSQALFPEFATVGFGDVHVYRKSAGRLGKALLLPSVVRGDNWFSAQLPGRTLGHAEPAIPSGDDPSQEIRHHPMHAENVEPAPDPYAGKNIGTPQLEDGQDAQAMFLLARDYANQGNLAVALNWCDKAIAADKMAARAYYLRAIILQEQGSVHEALAALKQTVYAEPRFVLGHFSLGNLALTQGRLRESEKHFENVLLSLAQYEPQDIVPESEGLSAGRLREMIVSQRGRLVPVAARSELSQSIFRSTGEAAVAQARSR